MDINLRCGVCGTEFTAENVDPAVNLGILQQWKDVHEHPTEEIKMYLDAETAVRQYQHTHKYGEEE